MRDESVRVDTFYQSEDIQRLTPFGQYDQYFYIVFAVPSGTVEHSHPTVCIFDDAVGYLIILLGEDKELDGLTALLIIQSEHDTNDEQGDETEDYPTPVVKHKVTGTDDEHITNHDHPSK